MRKRLTFILLALVLCFTGAMFAVGCKKDPVIYSVTYYAENGVDVLATKEVEEGKIATDVVDGVTEKAGYTVVWTDANGNAYDFTSAVNGNLALYLGYTANTDVAYKVEHYVQKTNGQYEVAETEEGLTGTTDTTVTANPKTFEGCTLDAGNKSAVASATLAGDGSTVLKLYYARNEYTVTFKNGNKKIDDKEVLHGVAVEKSRKVVADQNETVLTVDVFSHWSTTENGEAYDFNTLVTGNLTLYAVFKTESREYDVTVNTAGADGYWTLTDKDGAPLTEATVTAGQAFEFKLDLGVEAAGNPEVSAVIGNDIEETEETVPVTAVDGVYSVVITGETVISVKVEAVQYTVTATYSAPATADYASVNKQWANPYQNDESLVVVATNAETGEALTFENKCAGGVATFEIPAGEWNIILATYEGENLKVLTEEINYTINNELNNAEGNAVESELVIREFLLSKSIEVKNDGKVYAVDNGSMYATFSSFNPGTSDFAITVSYDQVMELFTPTTALETSPTLGIKFVGENGDRVGLHVYGEGSGRVILNDTWSEDMRFDAGNLMCSAGAIFGRLEWPDCYRHAEFTYVKKGDMLYVIVSADGNAGGLATNGDPIGSSAVTYTEYLLYAVDISTGTVYFNQSKKTGEYKTFQNDMIKEVLSTVTEAEFRKMCGGDGNKNQNNSFAYAYGYSYDADVINGYAEKYESFMTIATGGATVEVDGEAYAEAVQIANGGSVTVKATLPEGKIIDTIKDNGENVPFTIGEGYVEFKIAASFVAATHDVVITLKDGQYVDQTVVSGTVTAGEGKTLIEDRVVVQFSNAEGTVINGEYANGNYTVTLPAGAWYASVIADEFMSATSEIVAGESEALGANFVVDKYNDKRYAFNQTTGMQFNPEDGSLTYAPANTQDVSIAGRTFNPDNQILEFQFTLTGMVNSEKYPFLGMFIKDSEGGMIRVNWCAAGDEMNLMTSSDYPGRLKMMDANNWDFFGAKCGLKDPEGNIIATYYYTWQSSKTYVAAGEYHLDAKFIWDGYVFKLYARTSESLKVSDEWIEISNGFDVYNRYATATAGWQNQDYRNNETWKTDIFKTNLDCTFGVTARIDKGTTNTPKFSNIQWKITDKEA